MEENVTKRKNNKVDINNLSEQDRDILTLETQVVMEKYQLEKQNVYDRRFAINKKIKQAGLTKEELLNNLAPKKAKSGKKSSAKKTEQEKVDHVETEEPSLSEDQTVEEQKIEHTRELAATEKTIPVILKPIEISFENFSIKLNGVPKKISVNPETNAIEIDI